MANINDRLNRGSAGLSVITPTTATNALTAGIRIMKITLANGTTAGVLTVWNAAATSGTAGFTLNTPASQTMVLDLAPDGFVIVGGAVTATGTANIFYTTE